MRYLYLLLAFIFCFSSCKKDSVNLPVKTDPIDSIAGVWCLKSDTGTIFIIRHDLSIFYPKSIPPPLLGPDYSVTIQYSLDTSTMNMFKLTTTRAYPFFFFTRSPIFKGYVQDLQNFNSYLEIVKLN